MPRSRVLVAVLALAVGAGACSNDSTPDDQAAADPIELDFETEPQVAEIESTTTTAAPATTTTTTPPPPPGFGPPVAALDAAGIADQIFRTELAIRDPATPPDQLVAAARLQQVAYRRLGGHPEWDEEVLGRIPPELDLAVHRNIQARREFRAMHRKLSDHLPAWRIVEPLPADELLAIYREAEAEFGIAWPYLAAINLVETGMGRIRGTSVAGAQGPMQFMPATWEAFGAGGDINDTRDAIFAAARYLRHNGGHAGNIDGALWNYNHSWRYVAGVKAYADVMIDEPRTFYGFHQWQVVYLTSKGDVVLPVGYATETPIHVDEYRARHAG